MCSLISVYEAWESRLAVVCTVLLGKQQQLTVSDLPQGLLFGPRLKRESDRFSHQVSDAA